VSSTTATSLPAQALHCTIFGSEHFLYALGRQDLIETTDDQRRKRQTSVSGCIYLGRLLHLQPLTHLVETSGESGHARHRDTEELV
jgi:hypothetical protein